MSSILEQIVATNDARDCRGQSGDTDRRAAPTDGAAPAAQFLSGLAAPGPIRLIAEIKRASPSRGVIREDFQPLDIAATYAAHGASCLSVLTDVHYFQGSLEILEQVRASVSLPVLRKDFILDEYQLWEARVAGADAVLLIAEILDDCRLRTLHNAAVALGLAPLVELYEPSNLPARAGCRGHADRRQQPRLRRSFEVDLDHTLRLRDRIPDQCVLVSESGIRTHADVERLQAAGIDAILVGETLMSAPDIGAAVDTLLGREV